jgi:quercetin dioxygenase-like cupin family protein
LTATASAESATFSQNGSRKAAVVPQTNFSGTVIIEPLYPTNEHLPQTGGMVTFAPGARSSWHTHPAGQMLIVTSGTGWVQEDGGPKRELKPGDVVWTPPGVKHWHGATATSAMSHIALSNMHDGRNVDWLEKVSDDQYNAE